MRRLSVAGTNLVVFKLRWTGSGLQFVAEPVPGGPHSFVMNGVQFQRVRFERDALEALERAGVGSWSVFPTDHVQASVTRQQLRAMGFRGNY
ncbi:hypothetical protein [Acidipila sp. EB88]|uniref:hypothetical protein n=1 Tax=Acidipila sp. EB88 TaxID=2305226 RepID=UPI000F5EE860|nr:hypothetical protein [Acidipila sp. EB88]